MLNRRAVPLPRMDAPRQSRPTPYRTQVAAAGQRIQQSMKPRLLLIAPILMQQIFEQRKYSFKIAVEIEVAIDKCFSKCQLSEISKYPPRCTGMLDLPTKAAKLSGLRLSASAIP